METNSTTFSTPPPRFDVGEELSWLKGKDKQAVRLHPRRAGMRLPLFVSKVGGNIPWPGEEEWHRCLEHDLPFVVVLQLTREDFPELDFPHNTDLLQMLWCPQDHPDCGYAPCPALFWRKKADLMNSTGDNPRLDSGRDVYMSDYVPIECSLHPERVVEYPNAFELTDEECKLESEWAQRVGAAQTAYQYQLSTAPGTKLGGYPAWSQDPETPKCECGAEMEHLLSVDSAEWDGGTMTRWCVIEDRWAINKQTPYEQRSTVQVPMGLMIGDMGCIYVFVCRKCKPWRTKSVMQCS